MKKIFLIILFVLLCLVQLQAEKVKYIFLFVGDGMSASSEFALSNFLYGKQQSLFWNRFPVQTLMTTYSLSTIENQSTTKEGYKTEIAGSVPYPYYITDESEKYFKNSVPTDSSASATAFSTGNKIYNIGVCYDKQNDSFIRNLVDDINDNKEYNCALITTDFFYGATPASFFSHNKERFNSKQIAKEILSKTKPEIIVGKNKFYEIQIFAQNQNYYNLEDKDINYPQPFDLTTKKIFIDLKQYSIPKPQENFLNESFIYSSNSMKFSDFVLYSTKLLLDKRKPFFSLIEVADIDKANHDNDFNKMLGAMYELNETVKTIYDLIVSGNTDMTFSNTLLIVTADHATGMLRFNKYLSKGMLPQRDFVYNNNINIKVDDSIVYKTKGHTNELVGCYSVGKNSELFNKYKNEKNIIDNTNIYNVLNKSIK